MDIIDMTGEVGQQPLNVEEANVPRMINNKDIIDITGEAGQQPLNVEAPMIVLEELENVAMTLMNSESVKPIGEVTTFFCEKCETNFNTGQALGDHIVTFEMVHRRVFCKSLKR